MKTFPCSVALFFVAALALAESFTVRAGGTETIEIPGTTAAYATDPAIADVTVPSPGRVEIRGRSAGKTQVVTVSATGTHSFLIAVGPARAATTPRALKTGAPIVRADSRYSSSAAQLQTSVDVHTKSGERTTQVHVTNIHRTRETPGRSADAFPSIFYRVRSPRGELTLLDEFVDVSPLSVRGTQVRGVHLRRGPLELHGGYAASTMYEDLFLPADRRWVAGASYAIDAGGIRWIPSAWTFLSEPQNSGARRGVAGSLAAEHRLSESFFARAEISVARSVAAAGEIRFDGPRDHLRGNAWLRPEDFPTLGLTDLPGMHGELTWMRRQSSRLTLESRASYDDVTRGALQQTIGIGSASFRYALTRRLTLLGGADYVSQAGSSIPHMRTIGIPAGVAFDLPSFGASATYRLVDNSAAGRRSDSLRLDARASLGVFRVNAWAERQRQAPTLDLIFRATPGLELSLLDLGLSVRSPEDLARVLRDNGALINLGYISGVTVNLAPRRLQAGVSMAIGTTNQLRLRAAIDRVEGITATQQTAMAQLTYAWRITDATELYGAYSWWRIDSALRPADTTAFEFGVRQRLDGAPAVFQRGGSIEGIVFLDPEMEGTRGAASAPLADITITLDGDRTARTDRNGAYAFRNVGPGKHVVATQLPASRAAFFTTPSRVETEASAHVDFGVVWSPARITGRVVTDANLGVAGVVINAIAASGKLISATTDTSGEFLIAAPPGRYAIELSHDSIPAGYVAERATPQTVDVAADAPRSVAFDVRALRSIAGIIQGRSRVVRIEPLGRVAKADEEGNFVFRSLPPGSYELSAGEQRTTIVVPAAPGVISGVTLSERAAVSAGTETGFHLQAGAYRVAGNATTAKRGVERTGFRAEIARVGALHIVTVGPFPSRSAAAEAREQLQLAGFEAVVLSR